MNRLTYPPARLGWLIWGLGAAFYLYAFFQRVAPGVMTVELSADFNLSASALGNLSAFYFYSYVAMQIPTGIVADIWGPRKLLTAGALIASLGSLFFAFSDSFMLAATGRLLIGASVSVAFISMLKLASHWLDPRQYALASGMALFTGIIGAVFAGVPLHLLVEEYGWRSTMAASSIFPLVIALLIWIMVRDDPIEKGHKSYANHKTGTISQPWSHALKGLKAVLCYRNTWLLSLVPGGIVGSILAFAGLWGVPFLSTHHNMSVTDAAAICSAMLIVWAIGGPLLGAWSDRIGRQKPIYTIGLLVVASGWILIALIPGMPTFVLIGLLMIIGFFSGSMVTGFAYAKSSVPPSLSGTVSGIVNMGVMMGPMIMQPAVGWMLDKNWAGEMNGVSKVFSLAAYQSGFLLMALWASISFILILITQETQAAE